MRPSHVLEMCRETGSNERRQLRGHSSEQSNPNPVRLMFGGATRRPDRHRNQGQFEPVRGRAQTDLVKSN